METSRTHLVSETELNNLSLSFENLQVNDPSYSSFNQIHPSPVPVPLYPQSTWAVPSLSGRSTVPSLSGRSNPQYETITSSNFQTSLGFQANPLQHCANSGILLLAQDEQGSQYLQEKLTSGDSRFLDKVFNVVSEFTFQIICNQYARFVFGKFIEACNEDQLLQITLRITSKDQLFVQASVDKFGSSSIRKLMKAVANRPPLLDLVMKALKRLFRFLMMTKPGSSVVLQCLEQIYNHNNKNDFIYQAALEHCLYLACHEQGCINMNNFIDEMKGPRRKQILYLISMNAASLSRNFSGNYVVQHVLELEDPYLIETICFSLRGHYIDLSLTKCGSFVVQNCLKYRITVNYIVEEFLLNSDQIFRVACDKYGNYVIQTALIETMRPNSLHLHQRLVTKLRQNLDSLRFGYGKHVYNLIKDCDLQN